MTEKLTDCDICGMDCADEDELKVHREDCEAEMNERLDAEELA